MLGEVFGGVKYIVIYYDLFVIGSFRIGSEGGVVGGAGHAMGDCRMFVSETTLVELLVFYVLTFLQSKEGGGMGHDKKEGRSHALLRF